MRFLTLSILFFFSLFAGDLNQTLIKEQNATYYENLLKELNASAPEYKLQKTLLTQIKRLVSEPLKLPKIEDFQVKSEDEFVSKFLLINELLLQKEQTKAKIEDFKDQLDDIKEEIENTESNSTNLFTLNLQYAYYEKEIEYNRQLLQAIEKNYRLWIDALLSQLPKIEFSYDPKRFEKLTNQLQAIDKKIHKLLIEKERYTILNYQRSLKKTEALLKTYRTKKQNIIKSALKERFKAFFAALKKKSDKSLTIQKEILSFLQKEKSQLATPVKTTTDYAIASYLGSKKAFLLKLKEEFLDYLHANTFLDIPLYKFAEALGIFLLFLIFRRLFTVIILRSLHTVTKKTKTTIDDKIIALLEGPLKFTFIIIGLYLALSVAGVQSDIAEKIVKTLIIYVLFWLFYNLVGVLDETIYKFARKFGKELYREIGAFFIKTLKIFIFAIGLVSILQEWDINVSAFLASLGLGGLAFALAAKDTAANLFGGLSILADRALKIDDWIKVGSVEGTVEDIGLRTTKVRTFEKSLVTVPNQYIANNPIENFSRRNIRRIKMRIGLVYSTKPDQMRKILADIRNMLQSHPGIAKDATLLVNFDEFGSSDLSIFIYCFTNTANWAKYLEIREDINLKIMDIVLENGSDFAFPSESLYIEKLPEEIWKK